jgi:hypothetical protein
MPQSVVAFEIKDTGIGISKTNKISFLKLSTG